MNVNKGTTKEELLNASHLPIDPYQYLAASFVLDCTHSNVYLTSIMTFRFREKTQYRLIVKSTVKVIYYGLSLSHIAPQW